MRGGSPHYLCGYTLESSWSERYLDDSFARTLPLCEDCIESYELKYGSEAMERMLIYRETGIKQINPVEKVNHVETPSTETMERVRTLREYLEGVVA
tara:strand:+ start:3436 stop:3726 length:291 start_codon:yes stop_codon:yes gene_type:complete